MRTEDSVMGMMLGDRIYCISAVVLLSNNDSLSIAKGEEENG
jgi:hypothetical protein